MGDVVDFVQPASEEPVQYCHACTCGSQVFYLMYGGLLECPQCGHTKTQMIWTMIPVEISRQE